MAHDDDASSNRSWSLVGSKHGATVIPGDSSNVEVKYHQQQWDRSEYPGGLTPVGHPKDFTPGFMVCYTTRGGSENDCWFVRYQKEHTRNMVRKIHQENEKNKNNYNNHSHHHGSKTSFSKS